MMNCIALLLTTICVLQIGFRRFVSHIALQVIISSIVTTVGMPIACIPQPMQASSLETFWPLVAYALHPRPPPIVDHYITAVLNGTRSTIHKAKNAIQFQLVYTCFNCKVPSLKNSYSHMFLLSLCSPLVCLPFLQWHSSNYYHSPVSQT